MDVEVADTLDEGWRFWRAWQLAVAPDNTVEIAALEADGAALSDTPGPSAVAGRTPNWRSRSCPSPQYTESPLLRGSE